MKWAIRAGVWAGALIGVTLLRLAIFPTTFAHANGHAAPLVEGIFAFPATPHRSEYGMLSFAVLKAITALSGGGFETIAVANTIFGVLSLLAIAHIAARWSGRWAGVSVVVLGALYPAAAAIGPTEDAHNLAFACAWLGLACFDQYSARPRRSLLLAAAALITAAAFCRQTTYPLLAGGLWIVHAASGVPLGERLRDRAWVACVLAGVLAIAVRVGVTLSVDTDRRGTLMMLVHLLTIPEVVWTAVLAHPLIALQEGGALLLPGVVMGWFALTNRSLRIALASVLLGLFVLTLPMGFLGIGVRYSFRTPVIDLALLSAGIGYDWLFRRARAKARIAPRLLSALGVAYLGWVALHHVRTYRQPADYEEYRALQRLVARLPAGARVVSRPIPLPTNGGLVDAPPAHLLRERGDGVHLVRLEELRPSDFDEGPVLVYLGLRCVAMQLAATVGSTDPRLRGWMAVPEKRRRIVDHVFGHGPPLYPDHGAMERQPCRKLRELSVPYGEGERLTEVNDDPPFGYYGGGPRTVEFRRIDREAWQRLLAIWKDHPERPVRSLDRVH